LWVLNISVRWFLSLQTDGQRRPDFAPKNRLVLGAVVMAVVCAVVGLAMMFEWSSRSIRGSSPLLKDVAIARYVIAAIAASRAPFECHWHLPISGNASSLLLPQA